MSRSSDGSGFSRPLRVDVLETAGRSFEWQATEQERIDLAAFLGLERLEGLFVKGIAEPGLKAAIHLTADYVADVVQICVVTLEPVAARVTDTVEREFTLRSDVAAVWQEVDVEPGAEDPPDLVEGGEIDIGAVVIEALALAIDPYPRKPGVVLEYQPENPPDPGPFAALAKLKNRL